MTKKTKKTEAQKSDAPKPMERIEKLEQDIAYLVQVIGGVQEILQTFSQAVDALTTLAGPEKVFAEIDRAHCERQDAAIAQAVTGGDVVPVQVISAESFVRGQKVLDGKVVRPGAFYSQVADLKPDVRTALVGQALPATYQDPENGSILTITDAFDPGKGNKEAE